MSGENESHKKELQKRMSDHTLTVRCFRITLYDHAFYVSKTRAQIKAKLVKENVQRH